jgi:hypothetical protein
MRNADKSDGNTGRKREEKYPMAGIGYTQEDGEVWVRGRDDNGCLIQAQGV